MVQNGRLTMGTNYIAPIWRMPENTNKDKLSNYTIRWDSTDQGILTAPLEDFGIDNTFSFSLWAKPNSDVNLASYAHLFSNAALNSGGFGLYMAGDGNDSGTSGDLCFRFYVDNYNVSGRFINSEPINTEQWYHVVVTYSDADGANMYIDNASPITGVENRTAAALNNPVGIGCASNPVYGIRYQAKSSISEVCLFDYIIDTNQVQYLYNLNNPMAIPGGKPVGYWRIGDNSNPLALAGYPNISVGADSVFNFNGSGDYIDLGDLSNIGISNASAVSVSLWFNKNGNGNYVLFELKDGSSKIALQSYQANRLYIYINNRNYYVDTTVANGDWHNIILVFDGSGADNADKLKLYFNGSNITGGTYSGDVPASVGAFTSSMTSNIGRTPSTAYFDGYISNASIWDTALTSAQVSEIYNNGIPSNLSSHSATSNLVSWYKLNQTDSYWNIGETGKWTFNNAAIN